VDTPTTAMVDGLKRCFKFTFLPLGFTQKLITDF